jgi:putative endonuclease
VGGSRSETGAAAEEAAARFLEAAGFVILDRNLRVGRLEIDLVAREGCVVVLVEVRTRGPRSFVRGLDSIDVKKRARVRAAGEILWSTRFTHEPGVERMRFDAASVAFTATGPVVEHVRGAF